jgi:hypothetical protein
MRITITEIFYCNGTVLEFSNTDGTTVHTVVLYSTTRSTIFMCSSILCITVWYSFTVLYSFNVLFYLLQYRTVLGVKSTLEQCVNTHSTLKQYVKTVR